MNKSKQRKSNRPEGWLDAGWRVPLHLTHRQERYAWNAIGVGRFCYNLALKTHAFHRANRLKWPSVPDMQKAFNACKKQDYPFVAEVSKFVAEGGFQDFEKALNNWLNPHHPARRSTPRRKKWGNGSFLAAYGVGPLSKVDGKRIRLPYLGSVKMLDPLPSGRIFHEARIVRENGRWWLALLGYRKPPEVIESASVAGVDVGINPLAAVYDGGDEQDAELVPNPKGYYKEEKNLRRWQRAQARRTRGSRGWHEAQRRIDKIHRRIQDLRDNAQHQLSASLVKRYGRIGIESLKVKGLMKNPNLSKSLSEAALNKLLGRIDYKARWHGRELVCADVWYPSSKTCSDCGEVYADLELKDKRWSCPACCAEHDRDKNAARNLHKIALPAGRRDVTLPEGKALAVGNLICGETGPDEGRPRPGPAALVA